MLTQFIPIELQEGILVLIIIIIQMIIFRNTRAKIQIFQKAIPKEDQFQIVEAQVPIQVLEQKSTREIAEGLDRYIKKNEPEVPKVEEVVEAVEETPIALLAKNQTVPVPIIQTVSESQTVFKKILLSLNTYLLRNKGSVTDFSLVKDVVERHIDALDNDIKISLPIPLYLGLMATMAGIVLGLMNMPNLGIDIANQAEADNFSNGINILLSGVRIAMLASLAGLLLTTLNSGYFYKGSKSEVEASKNGFYTFLQTELLPILAQNVNASLYSLQLNLMQFNHEFTGNINRLGGMMGKNYDALIVQDRILDKLEKSDFTDLVKSNIFTFKKISKSVQELEKTVATLEQFNSYLVGMNEFITNTRALNSRVGEVLTRTDNFRVIAEQIHHNLNKTTQLQEFLNSHFTELEARKQLINNAVASVDDVLDRSLDELKEHVQEKISEIREFSIKQQDLMTDVMQDNAERSKIFFKDLQTNMVGVVEENQTAFHQLKHLKELSNNFATFIKLEHERSLQLTQALEGLQTSQQQTLEELQQQPTTWEKVGKVVYWSFQVLAIVFFGMMMFYFYQNGF